MVKIGKQKGSTKMNKNVTATISAHFAHVTAFDVESNDTVQVTTTVASKAFAERDAIAYCESKGLLFCEINSIEKGATCRVSMDAQEFFAKATKMDKRPNGAYISRNVTVYDVAIMAYSTTAHQVKALVIKSDTDNNDTIERIAKRYCKANELRFLKSNGVINSITALYVMSVDEFMKWGKVVPFVDGDDNDEK